MCSADPGAQPGERSGRQAPDGCRRPQRQPLPTVAGRSFEHDTLGEGDVAERDGGIDHRRHLHQRGTT